jgi:hypothetical protein
MFDLSFECNNEESVESSEISGTAEIIVGQDP